MVLYSKAEDIVEELKTKKDITDYIYDLMKAVYERDEKIENEENTLYNKVNEKDCIICDLENDIDVLKDEIEELQNKLSIYEEN